MQKSAINLFSRLCPIVSVSRDSDYRRASNLDYALFSPEIYFSWFRHMIFFDVLHLVEGLFLIYLSLSVIMLYINFLDVLTEFISPFRHQKQITHY